MALCQQERLIVTENPGTSEQYTVFDSEPHFCGRPIFMFDSPGELTYELATEYYFNLTASRKTTGNQFYFEYSSSKLWRKQTAYSSLRCMKLVG